MSAKFVGVGMRMVLITLLVGSPGCGICPPSPKGAGIKVTASPRSGVGGPDETDDIAGSVTGTKPAEARVVIYAHSGDRWWVQPLEDDPFTAIKSGLEWNSRIHLGFEYAALLVHKSYTPPKQPMSLPPVEGCVWAMDIAKPRQ